MGRGKPPNALRAKGLEKEEEEEVLKQATNFIHLSLTVFTD
jgi:hypothetical protein